MTAAETAQVAAAVAAAGAAGAAWFTAATNARTFCRSIQPTLVGQPIAVVDAGQSQVHMDVHNAGGGIAFTCAYILVASGDVARGHLAHGTLGSGDYARVRTTIQPPERHREVRGVVACRDAAGTVWAWRLGGADRKNLGRTQELDDPLPTMEVIFGAFYPGVRLETLHPVPSDVLSSQSMRTDVDLLFKPTAQQILSPWTD